MFVIRITLPIIIRNMKSTNLIFYKFCPKALTLWNYCIAHKIIIIIIIKVIIRIIIIIMVYSSITDHNRYMHADFIHIKITNHKYIPNIMIRNTTGF